jgi:hypothetical protein
MSAINDLQILISEMNPRLNAGEYVYCTISDPGEIKEDQILFSFKEEEGLSVILSKEYADKLGLNYYFVSSWITLTVHSSLSATGLTAAFSNALADAGISCNVVAATCHDHIFVDVKDSEKALAVLSELQLREPLEIFYCVTCGTELVGNYCHKCGEKVVSPHDFTFAKLLEQGVDIFTHLDSKLFKSLKGLVLKPGSLAINYIQGIRKPYMKPFQVFLLSNILFFFFLSSADIFLVPSKWFFTDYYPGISNLAQDVAIQKKMTLKEVALLYDTKVASNSKLFVVSVVPFLALGTWLFGFRQHKEFGKHLVHALFLLSFAMVFSVAISQIPEVIIFSIPEIVLRISTTLLCIGYIYLSLKKFLSQSFFLRVANTLVFFVIFFFTLLSYRYIISWLTLKYFLQ